MEKDISLKDYIDLNKLSKVKLHLGCGGVRWQDFVNVDFYPHDLSVVDSSRNGCHADIFADMTALGLPNNFIDEIFTSHTVDHFTRWVAVDMFTDWFRMLKPNGRMVIEVADFNRCILWLIHPDREKRQAAKNQFYGNQWDRIDFQTHRYAWSASELAKVLRDIGFQNVTYNHKTVTHYAGRDMRMIAIK